MSDAYLLESGTDRLLLEDGTSLLLTEPWSFPIAAGTDDGYSTPSALSNTGTSVIVGVAAGDLLLRGYLRFTALPMAKGDTISGAILRVRSNSAVSAPDVLVKGQAIDDSVAPTTFGELNGYSTTTASTTFTPASSTPYELDVNAVVQEIVNRAGWVSGNDLTFLIDNNKTLDGAAHTDTIASFEDPIPDRRPQLSLYYSTVGSNPRPVRNMNREAVHRAARW